jgi:hypothetical protein
MAERSAYLRATLYGRAIRYDTDKVQSSPADTMSDRLADVCDHDARIRKRQRKLDKQKTDVRQYLYRMPNTDYARALDLFYLSLSDDGKLLTWADVARVLGKDESYIRKVTHYRAIDQFNNILKNS